MGSTDVGETRVMILVSGRCFMGKELPCSMSFVGFLPPPTVHPDAVELGMTTSLRPESRVPSPGVASCAAALPSVSRDRMRVTLHSRRLPLSAQPSSALVTGWAGPWAAAAAAVAVAVQACRLGCRHRAGTGELVQCSLTALQA